MSAIGPKRTSLIAPHMSALELKQTWPIAAQMSAYDPKRTSAVIGMMRNNGTTVRWVLSVAILISVANFNIAQAQKGSAAAAACGKELISHCSGAPVPANNMLECLRKDQEKLSESCATLANRVVFRCERDVFRLCRDVVAGQGNVLGCLTKAKRSVSSRCNEALDAAFLRQ